MANSKIDRNFLIKSGPALKYAIVPFYFDQNILQPLSMTSLMPTNCNTNIVDIRKTDHRW